MKPFWELDFPESSPAFVDGETGAVTTYGALRGACEAFAQRLPRGEPGFVVARNALGSVVPYLAALRAGCPVYPFSPTTHPELLAALIDTYAPGWLVLPEGVSPPEGYAASPHSPGGVSLALRESAVAAAPVYPELAVLLTTSGSTGSPKLVRLSRTNVAANAESIADYLEIGPGERAVTTLSFHYSYGLSVINSHLARGACVVLTERTVLEKEFWALVRDAGVTSLAGVPYLYTMLHRLRFRPEKYPTLRTMTQAGGRLDPVMQKHFGELCAAAGVRFFVMYGQTEATARISYVPADRLAEKLGTIGVAIPGGSLAIAPDTGELVYRGPNVMLGYAESRADLAKGDELGGVLRTGDAAECDADGFYRITGRLKRFIKIFGHRVNLDEVEAAMASHGHPACTGDDDALVVCFEGAAPSENPIPWLTSRFGINATAVRLRVLPEFPRTASGKIDYKALHHAACVSA